jgi:hypothetical protein
LIPSLLSSGARKFSPADMVTTSQEDVLTMP